jgi:hypothetical protein
MKSKLAWVLVLFVALLGGGWFSIQRDFGRLDRLELLDRPEPNRLRPSLIIRNGGSSAVRFKLRCVFGNNPNNPAVSEHDMNLLPNEISSVLIATAQELQRAPGTIRNQFCFVIGQSLFGFKKNPWRYYWKYAESPVKNHYEEAKWFRGQTIPVE